MWIGGQDWPDLINQLVTPSSSANNKLLPRTNCFTLYVFVALWTVVRINWVIPSLLPECINHVSLVWLVVICSSMSPSWTWWRVEAWLMNYIFFFQCLPLGVQLQMGPIRRVYTEVSKLSSDDESKTNKKFKSIPSETWLRFLVISLTWWDL